MKNIFLISSLIILGCSVSVAQNFQWATAIGGTGSDKGLSVNVDSQGNVYTIGFFVGTVDFDPGPGIFNLTTNGTQNLFICKLSNSGNFIWAKSIGVSMQPYIPSVAALDASDNIYITGAFQDTVDFDPDTSVYFMNSTNGAIFILKLNSSGSFGWVKKMDALSGYGGHGKAVALDLSGNVYITGDFNGTVDFNPDTAVFSLTSISAGWGVTDVFVVKLNSTGNFIWAKSFGGSATQSSGTGWSLAVDNSGNVVTTGGYRATVDFDPGIGIYNLISTNGADDIFIQKMDSSGNFLWARSFGSAQVEQGWSVAFDVNGNVYTTGYFRETVDFDPGPGIFNLSTPGGTSDEIFILKLNAQGNFIWAKAMGGDYQDQGLALTVDIYGSVYATGYYNHVADFDPGPATYYLTTAGSWDIFIVKLDSSGNFNWAKSVGGTTPWDWGYSLAVDSSQNVFTTGYFTDTADFDPGTGIYNLISTGNGDAFVLKLSGALTGIAEIVNGNSAGRGVVFPNPFSNTTTISFSLSQSEKVALKIFDVSGRLVTTLANKVFDAGANKLVWNASEVNAGIYFLQFQSSENLKTEKLIVTK